MQTHYSEESVAACCIYMQSVYKLFIEYNQLSHSSVAQRCSASAFINHSYSVHNSLEKRKREGSGLLECAQKTEGVLGLPTPEVAAVITYQ